MKKKLIVGLGLLSWCVIIYLLIVSGASKEPSISGYVITSNGNPIPGANVELEIPELSAYMPEHKCYADPQDMGLVHETTANKRGYFCFTEDAYVNQSKKGKVKYRVTAYTLGYEKKSIGLFELTPDAPQKKLEIRLNKKGAIDLKNIDKNKTSILIEKSKYKLTVFYKGKLLKSYPVVFGSNSVDDKLKEGDKCTPEGKFKIRNLYPHREWSKFLHLDYPTEESWKKHNKAKQEGIIDEKDTIGSEIGIHGVPDGNDYLIDDKYNWTLGCISLKNEDINELYQMVKKGTEIEIVH